MSEPVPSKAGSVTWIGFIYTKLNCLIPFDIFPSLVDEMLTSLGLIEKSSFMVVTVEVSNITLRLTVIN